MKRHSRSRWSPPHSREIPSRRPSRSRLRGRHLFCSVFLSHSLYSTNLALLKNTMIDWPDSCNYSFLARKYWNYLCIVNGST